MPRKTYPKRPKPPEGLYWRPEYKTLWASWKHPNGELIRFDTWTADPELAKKVRDTRIRHELEDYVRPDDERQTFHDVLGTYLRDRPDLVANKKNHQSFNHIRKFFPREQLASKTRPSDIERFISHLRQEGLAPATINKDIGFISAAYNHCIRKHDWPLINPAAGKKLSEPKPRPKFLTPEDFAKLLAASYQECRAWYLPHFIIITIGGAFRKSETLKLKWDRIDFKHQLILFDPEDQKSRRVASTPISSDVMPFLLELKAYHDEHCRWSPWVFCRKRGDRIRDVRRSFGSAVKRAGIPHTWIHMLRHTAASWLVQNGMPLQKVQQVLRHASITQTERYAYLNPEHTREAVDKLGGLIRLRHPQESQDTDL